jgi:nicotinamide-nucleotide amidase
MALEQDTALLAQRVGQLLKAQGLMLSTAESCTGGGVSQAITDVAGSSAWFDRGFITYSNISKQQLLSVPELTLTQYGAVSEAVVRKMVAGALDNSVSTIALSVSGIAGPDGGTPEKPVGTVWFAWGMKSDVVITKQVYFKGDRTNIRTQAVNFALQGVLDLILMRTVAA